MKIPNWQHHSKKEKKRHLRPQALRAAKKRLQVLKSKLDILIKPRYSMKRGGVQKIST